jgi:hypothetical protein
VKCDKFNIWLGHAYLITYNAAVGVLKNQKKIACMCDDWSYLNKAGCFDFFLISRSLFYQDQTFVSNLREKMISKIPNYKLHNSKLPALSIYITRVLKLFLLKLRLFGFKNWLVISR